MKKVDVNALKAQGFSDARIKKLVDARARRGVKLGAAHVEYAAKLDAFRDRYVPIYPNVSRHHPAARIAMNSPPVVENAKKARAKKAAE